MSLKALAIVPEAFVASPPENAGGFHDVDDVADKIPFVERGVGTSVVADGLAGTVVHVSDNGIPTFLKKNHATGEDAEVAQPADEGAGILRLDQIHPNMYLTNLSGAVEMLKGATDDAAVFSILDLPTINMLTKIHRKRLSSGRVHHHVRDAMDTTQMEIDAFYKTFYFAARQIEQTIDSKATVVHCQAGMNRSCTAIIFFAILRAFDTEKLADGSETGRFGTGKDFNLKDMIQYTRVVNKIGRYPVLTNPLFVALLKHVRDFEQVLHLPINKKFLDARNKGRLDSIGKVFKNFVHNRTKAHR